MKLEGGCYCGNVRHVAEGEPTLKAMPTDGFSYTMGRPKQFARTDLERPVTEK